MHGCNAIFSPWYSSSCKVPMLIRLLSEPESIRMSLLTPSMLSEITEHKRTLQKIGLSSLKMASQSASSLLSGALCSQLWVSSPLCNRHWRLGAWLRWKAEKVSSLFLLRTSPASSLIQVIFENGLPVKWRVHIFEPVRARGTKGEFRFVFFQRNLQLSLWDVWTMEIRLIFFRKGSMTNHSWIAYCVSFRQFLLLVSNYISNSSSLGPTSNAKMTMGYSRSPCSPA